MKLSETIASNIKRLRLAQNITQEEAAFRCDISTRHYSDVENSKTNLSVDVLDKLGYGLGVPPAELVGLHMDWDFLRLLRLSFLIMKKQSYGLFFYC